MPPYNTIVATDFTLPTYIFDNGQVTGNEWNNGLNMFLVDQEYANANANTGASSDITVGGYNFQYNGISIPQGAVITGIELQVIGYRGAQTSPVITLDISLYDNTDGANDFYPYVSGFTGLTETDTTTVLGTSTYLFNSSFTVDQINNLKMNLKANGDINLDSFLVRVYFYIPAPTPEPDPVVGVCIDCDSPIQVQAMYLELPFLSGETVFYLKKGSLTYPNGVPVQPGDIGSCGGKIDFVFDEGKKKEDGNFEENVRLDSATGSWSVLPSGVIEVDIDSVNNRGLDYKQPGTHVASNMSNHDANSKVIISNNTPYNLGLVRRCQADTVFSPPIDVEQEDVNVVNPVHTFNFKGGGVVVAQNGTDPFQADITIAGSGTSTPVPDATSSTTSGNVQVPSLTWEHTVSGTDRLLTVQVSMEAGKTVTGITYNGVAMSLSIAVEGVNTRSETWYLIAPSLGTHDIVVTFSADSYSSAGAESWSGVDQVTPIGDTSSGTGTSLSPAVVVNTLYDNSVVVDGLSTALTPILHTPGAGQIENWHEYAVSDTRQGSSSYELAGSAPDAVTMSYAITQNTEWSMTAIEIKGITAVTSTLEIEDEGISVDANVTKIDFVGAGVTATQTAPGQVEVNIPGGGGGSLDLEVDGVPNGDQTLLNLIAGSGIILTDDGVGGVTIEATGGGGGGGGGGSSTLKVGVGGRSDINWFNIQYPFVPPGASTFDSSMWEYENGLTVNGWASTALGSREFVKGNTGGGISVFLPCFDGATENLRYDSGKQVIFQQVIRSAATSATENLGGCGFDIGGGGGSNIVNMQGTNDVSIGFVRKESDGTWYARAADGVSFTEVLITISDDAEHTLRAEYDPANAIPQARYYVDGELVATITTNLPTAVATDIYYSVGNGDAGAGADIAITFAGCPSFAIELVPGSGIGGEGNSIEIEALEDLSAGDPVGYGSLTPDTVARAVRATATQSTSAPTGLSIGSIIRLLWDTGNVFALLYNYPDGTDRLMAVAITVDPDTMDVSYGTAVQLSSNIEANAFMCKLDTGKYAVTYINDGANDSVRLSIFSLTGTTVVEESNVVIFTAPGSEEYTGACCETLATDELIFTTNNNANSNQVVGYVTVSTYTATLVDSDTSVPTGFSGSQAQPHKIVKIDTNRFAVVNGSPGTGSDYHAYIGEITGGTTLNIGSGQAITTGTYSPGYASLLSDAADTFYARLGGVLAYCTVAGTTITTVDTLDIANDDERGIIFTDGTDIREMFTSSVATQGFYSIVLSGGTTLVRTLIYGTVAVPGFEISYNTTNSYWFAFGDALTFHIKGMSAFYIGVVQSTVTAGQIATVLIDGVDENQTGLSPGALYEVTDGGFSLTADPTLPWKVQAQSSTKIKV